jgi:hypothetical protein
MLKTVKWNMLIVNIFIDIIIVILSIIFSETTIYEKLKFSLIIFVFGIVCSLFLTSFFYGIYQINELMFKVSTLFFLVSSLLGIITICVNLIKDDLMFLSSIIPLINMLFLCLYVRIYIWKIDRNKYMEYKKQNKINRDNKKIII